MRIISTSSINLVRTRRVAFRTRGLVGTGSPKKEQTFLRCVRKSNITQELSQGNESPRTS
jgi:hypothetical protein